MRRPHVLVPLAAAFLFAAPPRTFPSTPEVVVNIDINLSEESDPNDPNDPSGVTHVGDDGVFSNPGGDHWNGVAVGRPPVLSPVSNLLDEFMGPTPFDANVTGTFLPCPDCAEFNFLQDGGVHDSPPDDAVMTITDLVPGGLYDLAVYGCVLTEFVLQHAGGVISGRCNVRPTCTLPGTAGADYCTSLTPLEGADTPLTDLMPFEITTGVFGLRVSPIVGPLLGLQIRGPTEGTFPTPTRTPDAPTPTRTPDAPSPTDRATPSGELEHFQCYGVRGHRFARAGVTLRDQFEDRTVRMKNLKRLCLPANKNDEDPTAVSDPEHLAGYQIDQAGRFEPRKVIVVNQFSPEGETLEVKRPEFLLVPTAKSTIGPTDPLDPVTTDHFKCYKVRGLRTRLDAMVEDQFGTLAVRIKKPRWLCNPVDKNEEGILDPEAHLTCYRVRARPRRPDFTGPVAINNQFGPDMIEAGRVDGTRATEICLPSVKIDPQ